MNFHEELNRRVQAVEQIIQSYLPEETGEQKTVLEAMNYSVLAGGKRIRPLLMQETYRLFGGYGKEIEPFMAAMEMIHTASLVHDDLPAMDADEYRRGRKTTWVVYGEDMAILAGDALMIYAFETAIKALSLGGDPIFVGTCMGILANRTGIYGMIGGQSVDVELTKQDVGENQLDFIYRLKTGALLEASMQIGAVLGGAAKEEREKVTAIARDVGMAFQIQDDILDVVGEQEKIGKPIKSDEKNQKTTYVTQHGLEKAREMVAFYSERAISALLSFSYENPFLEQLIRMLITRDK